MLLYPADRYVKGVGAVETVLWFPRSLWTRSVRPQLRQLPPPEGLTFFADELGSSPGVPEMLCALSASLGLAPW